MTGIKIEWEEPGPADKCRLTVAKSYSWRDPTESDLTRALELLAPEVRGRVIGAVKAGGVADHRHLVDVMFGHLPTGTSGMVQGADGWEYPKAGPPGVVKSWDEAHDAAHWKAEAEREASAAAELRGDCRELSAKLAGAVEDRDKARAAMDHWRDRAAAAEKERDEAVEKKPKLSTDDITAALWAMPGKERAVLMYPFWPAISEAAQRTHLADERATAAMADAALARLLLNDCRRVLTKAENDRDEAIAKLEAVRRAAK